MNITEFLEARIAEDEERAKRAAAVDRGPEMLGRLPNDLFDGLRVAFPARVLAEIAAKRAIIAKRQWIDRSAGMDDWYSGYSDANYDALNALAAVYKDHADYDPAWSPNGG